MAMIRNVLTDGQALESTLTNFIEYGNNEHKWNSRVEHFMVMKLKPWIISLNTTQVQFSSVNTNDSIHLLGRSLHWTEHVFLFSIESH